MSCLVDMSLLTLVMLTCHQEMARHHSSEHLISDCQKEDGDRLRGSQLYYTLGEFGDSRFDP